MKKILYAVSKELFPTIFSKRDVARISRFYEPVLDEFPANPDKEFILKNAGEAEVIVTSWGTAALDGEVINAAPNLKLVTHAAGSVKPIVSDELWDAGVRVCSSAAAIAYGVAEFCLGTILTATKRAYWLANSMRQGGWQEMLKSYGGASEIYQQKVGLIGAGHVGRHLIRLLQNFSCDICLYDPYCSAEDANRLGVAKIDRLEDIFSLCAVVCLTAPLNDETKGMLRGSHFALLRDGAVFVSTSHNHIINEPEFIDELQKGRFVACMDVTYPEPCLLQSPYRNLPNVILTPHVAGVVAQNRLRIGTFVADAVEAFNNDCDLAYEVTREQLSRIS